MHSYFLVRVLKVNQLAELRGELIAGGFEIQVPLDGQPKAPGMESRGVELVFQTDQNADLLLHDLLFREYSVGRFCETAQGRPVRLLQLAGDIERSNAHQLEPVEGAVLDAAQVPVDNAHCNIQSLPSASVVHHKLHHPVDQHCPLDPVDVPLSQVQVVAEVGDRLVLCLPVDHLRNAVSVELLLDLNLHLFELFDLFFWSQFYLRLCLLLFS